MFKNQNPINIFYGTACRQLDIDWLTSNNSFSAILGYIKATNYVRSEGILYVPSHKYAAIKLNCLKAYVEIQTRRENTGSLLQILLDNSTNNYNIHFSNEIILSYNAAKNLLQNHKY